MKGGASTLQPVRWLAVLFCSGYYHAFYRMRGWGTLPRRRPPSLLVANHQHEMESPALVATLSLKSFMWRTPMYTVSSRRLWEPGFFAERIPWLRPVMRGVNLGWLFETIGMQPIENELHSRPFASIAYTLIRAHGDLPTRSVFRERALARIPGISTLTEILAPRNFDAARTAVSLSELNDPYRAEMLAATREELDADIVHFEDLVRGGATIFLTPEGFYSGDGKMQRFRGILSRLAPLARIYIAGVSYDPFMGRRLSMLYRVRETPPGALLETEIKRTRPVTTSALLGTWLHEHRSSFREDDAIAAVKALLANLPAGAFVDPELVRDPEAQTKKALEGMTALSMLRCNEEAYELTASLRHPDFPRTDDMVVYQANFHAETLAGLCAPSS